MCDKVIYLGERERGGIRKGGRAINLIILIITIIIVIIITIFMIVFIIIQIFISITGTRSNQIKSSYYYIYTYSILTFEIIPVDSGPEDSRHTPLE